MKKILNVNDDQFSKSWNKEIKYITVYVTVHHSDINFVFIGHFVF